MNNEIQAVPFESLKSLPVADLVGRVAQLEYLFELALTKLQEQEREIASLKVKHAREDAGWFSEAEVAEKLNISVKTLRRWRKSGVISCVISPTGRVQYSQDHIDEYLKKCTQHDKLRAA